MGSKCSSLKSRSRYSPSGILSLQEINIKNDIKTNTAACATDLAAIEVLHTATNQKLDDIETAVQLIDNGYGAMTTETIMNASVNGSAGEGTSSVFTKTREIENIGFSIVAPSNGSYTAFIEFSVDNSTFFSDTNLLVLKQKKVKLLKSLCVFPKKNVMNGKPLLRYWVQACLI